MVTQSCDCTKNHQTSSVKSPPKNKLSARSLEFECNAVCRSWREASALAQRAGARQGDERVTTHETHCSRVPAVQVADSSAAAQGRSLETTRPGCGTKAGGKNAAAQRQNTNQRTCARRVKRACRETRCAAPVECYLQVRAGVLGRRGRSPYRR